MVNQLLEPLRIYERGLDDLVIMVPHDTRRIRYETNQRREQRKQRTERTRRFVNWLRIRFPHVSSEFRYLHKGWGSCNWGRHTRRISINKHFVAYGLTRKDMLLVKMSWIFESQSIRIEKDEQSDEEAGAYYAPEWTTEPSSELKERLLNENRRVKALPTTDR